MHVKADEVAERVGDDVTLAAPCLRRGRLLIFLPASKPRGPPLSVVFTDWLSMTPAVGLASRPDASRDATTRTWLIRSQVPSHDQR
jgi:hypothetical protein